LFRTAASDGNATAMDHLGEMYAKGIEFYKDCQTARQWLEKAAATGYKTANQHLQSGFDGQCQW
jgi:TPR repeat protein